jgi:hypothetical protein
VLEAAAPLERHFARREAVLDSVAERDGWTPAPRVHHHHLVLLEAAPSEQLLRRLSDGRSRR